MIFGYNTDVKSGDTVYHVQTEDRGDKNPVIDSVIYVKGRIVDRRRTPYRPGENPPERLQEMVKAQHRDLVDSIRGGTYVLPDHTTGVETPSVVAPKTAAAQGTASKAEAAPVPSLELTNPGDVAKDGKLRFRLRVVDRSSGRPLAGASVQALLEPGEAREAHAEASTSAEGVADISFNPPSRDGGVVLFQAVAGEATGVLKFRLLQQEEE